MVFLNQCLRPLEELVMLEKLWLNRNHILIIDSLKKLKKLK
jgi:Leucine-rich repeat (LRR) protein